MRTLAIILLLSTGIGAAAAQPSESDATTGVAPSSPRLELSPPQRTAIRNAVQPETQKANAPTESHASVGMQVLPSTELRTLPEPALAAAPDAKGFKYTIVLNQVLLVDPITLRVVDVIDR